MKFEQVQKISTFGEHDSKELYEILSGIISPYFFVEWGRWKPRTRYPIVATCGDFTNDHNAYAVVKAKEGVLVITKVAYEIEAELYLDESDFNITSSILYGMKRHAERPVYVQFPRETGPLYPEIQKVEIDFISRNFYLN